MQPDARPERHLADLERRTAASVRGEPPAEPSYFTATNWVVIVLGFALAFGLALLVYGVPAGLGRGRGALLGAPGGRGDDHFTR